MPLHLSIRRSLTFHESVLYRRDTALRPVVEWSCLKKVVQEAKVCGTPFSLGDGITVSFLWGNSQRTIFCLCQDHPVSPVSLDCLFNSICQEVKNPFCLPSGGLYGEMDPWVILQAGGLYILQCFFCMIQFADLAQQCI